MEVTVRQLEGVSFVIGARSHAIVCDQPGENGGMDTGMTPPELMLAALGSCAAFYAVEYLRTRRLAESGLAVKVTAEKLKQPARLGQFCVEVTSPVALTEEQQEGLMRSVRHCLIHNTLLSAPEIAFELCAPVIAEVG